MTIAELCDAMPDKPYNTVKSAIRRAQEGKHIRIHGWHRNLTTRGSFSPKFGLHDGKKDAPPPNLTHEDIRKQVNARFRERHRLKLAMKQQIRRHGSVSPFFQLQYQPRPTGKAA